MLSHQLMRRLYRDFLDNTSLHGNVPLFINIRKNTNDVKENKNLTAKEEKDLATNESKDVTVSVDQNLIVNDDNAIDKANRLLDVSSEAFQLHMENTWKYRWVLKHDRSAIFKLLPEPVSNRFYIFQIEAPPLTSYVHGGMEGLVKKIVTKFMKKDQRFDYERHEMLGCDLAAAHFFVHRGGRVRFKGHKEWITTATRHKLPYKFDPDYKLVELDASNVQIYYEGLDNIYGLFNLQWLSFRGCPYFDDWCLDKISSQFPLLQYLDISECEKITERGLEALYRMNTLKTLIVTNYSKSATFELVCLLLEDCMPGLTCIITLPKTVEAKEKFSLLRSPLKNMKFLAKN